LLILQLLDLVLLALNLALLLLNLRLSLSLFVLPILHRVADQRTAEQAQAAADGRAGPGITGEGTDNRAGRRTADRSVGGALFACGERLSGAGVSQEQAGYEHCRTHDSHTRPHVLSDLAIECHDSALTGSIRR
jgi:hypothetical protein